MNKNETPRVSIVTAVYNCEEFIEETIRSVLGQTYKNIEYIIIDGNSTDKTVEIIEKYSADLFYFKSEPDNGMYAAINKGFEKSTGELMAYLNADDLYDSDYIEHIVDTYKKTRNADLFFSDTKFIDINGSLSYIYKSVSLPRRLIRWLRRPPFSQQSACWTRKVYKENYGFDDKLKYVADSKFFLNLLLSTNVNYVHIKRPLVSFRIHSSSLTISEYDAMQKESKLMRIGLQYLDYNFTGMIKFIIVNLIVKAINFKKFFTKGFGL